MRTALVMIAGEEKAGTVLASSLEEEGLEARYLPAEGLPDAFISLERELEATRPAAAVAVGTGEEALALAVTASKLGIPLATTRAEDSPSDDRGRALRTLSWLDAGEEGAARAIATWLRDDPSPQNLDSQR